MTIEHILAFIGALVVGGFLARITENLLFKPVWRWFDRRRYSKIKAEYESGWEEVNLCYGSNYITFEEWLKEGKPGLPLRGVKPQRY